MYSRNLLKTSHFAAFPIYCFHFLVVHTVYAYILCMYCENVIVYQKSISKFFVQKIPRVHFSIRIFANIQIYIPSPQFFNSYILTLKQWHVNDVCPQTLSNNFSKILLYHFTHANYLFMAELLPNYCCYFP